MAADEDTIESLRAQLAEAEARRRGHQSESDRLRAELAALRESSGGAPSEGRESTLDAEAGGTPTTGDQGAAGASIDSAAAALVQSLNLERDIGQVVAQYPHARREDVAVVHERGIEAMLSVAKESHAREKARLSEVSGAAYREAVAALERQKPGSARSLVSSAPTAPEFDAGGSAPKMTADRFAAMPLSEKLQVATADLERIALSEG